MKDLLVLLLHLLTTFARLLGPGGTKAIVADSLRMRQPLLIINRSRRSAPGSDGGPSWLTFIGHMKDSLRSVDLFRWESILLKTHWVLVVVDQFKSLGVSKLLIK